MDTCAKAESAATATTPGNTTEPRAGNRFWRYPLTWMVVGLFAIALASLLTPLWAPLFPIASAILALGAYRLVMRRVAHRDTPEIARAGALREALLGSGLGLGFLTVSVLPIVVFGGYSFTWNTDNVIWTVITVASVSLAAAVTEELMFRGLALQALEQVLGSRLAVAITAAFFGLAHLGNPGATLWGSMAIAIEAGVLIGVAYLWRRSIWFVVGLHFTWNTVQSLLGIPTSGHDPHGLMHVETHGPTVWSGGDFGLEGSIVPVGVSLAIIVVMYVRARRNRQLVPVRRSRR